MSQGTRTTTLGYDARNRLTTTTDTLDRTVSYEYDDADRVTRQTLPDGRFIGFTYDDKGNLTSVTPASRPQHVFTMNAVDLATTYTPPPAAPGGPTHYDYNLDRQLTLVTRPDSKGAYGRAAAGAAAGITTLYLGPIAAGAVGGLVSNGLNQMAALAAGTQCGVNWTSLAVDTAVGRLRSGNISNIRPATGVKMFIGAVEEYQMVPSVYTGVAASTTMNNLGGSGQCGCP
jgi:YD repeat-containing protein